MSKTNLGRLRVRTAGHLCGITCGSWYHVGHFITRLPELELVGSRLCQETNLGRLKSEGCGITCASWYHLGPFITRLSGRLAELDFSSGMQLLWGGCGFTRARVVARGKRCSKRASGSLSRGRGTRVSVLRAASSTSIIQFQIQPT